MRVAVLGGGLQGACVALELASAGVRVDLYDKNEQCLTQASAQNEGKLHLGYVYANDPSLNTARTMVRGALAFAPLLRRWLGDAVDTIPVSTPFHYVVHADSLLSVADVEGHLRAAHAIALEAGRGDTPDYFGADYRLAPTRLSDRTCDRLFDRRTVLAAYQTMEIAIDPDTLAALVRSRLAADPHIHSRLRTYVQGVELHERGVIVDFETSGNRGAEVYDHVVNCLWDGRLAVDKTMGLVPHRPWLYRVKHNLRVRCPGLVLPSVTIMLGPFGDTVDYGTGALYLSWYPAGMSGTSSEISPPAWPLTLDDEAKRVLYAATVAGLAPIIRAIASLGTGEVEAVQVKGGIIFAWGKTDIHDPASGLHTRYAIGPQSYGRYHTVDTGKLTMAPLFGKLVADRIRAIGR